MVKNKETPTDYVIVVSYTPDYPNNKEISLLPISELTKLRKYKKIPFKEEETNGK